MLMRKLILQSLQARALNAVALQDDGGFVVAVDAVGLDNFVSKRQRLVNTRHAIVQNDLGLLAHARRIWQQASAEPIASPSGRACEVSTNRLRCSMCLRTSFNMHAERQLQSVLQSSVFDD